MKKINLKIEYVPIETLTPYKNNARKHGDEDVGAITESIKEFGFDDPIGVWHDTIVEGHGRLLAAKSLGMETVPIIRLDHLTDDQRKAYALAHNRTAELSSWNKEMRDIEIENIEIDMTRFGFEIEEKPLIDEEHYYGDERERTDKEYNLHLVSHYDLTDDFWEMPIIYKDDIIPTDLIGFNYAKTSADKNAGIHFFIDDYQFERVWDRPEAYRDILAEYECILTPDFSLYMDMPRPMKIWNIYRSRMVGAYYQRCGIKVIPTVSWAEPETYEFCFRGIEKGSIVAVSTVGIMKDEDATAVFMDGIKEMVAQIKPSKILLYGKDIPLGVDIETAHYKNKVTERMSQSRWVDEDHRAVPAAEAE